MNQASAEIVDRDRTIAGTPRAARAPYAWSLERVARELETDLERGLSGDEAALRQARHGPNELAEAPGVPLWRRFVAQFQELVVLILIAAAVIAAVQQEWPDTLAILAIILLNAILGLVQEARAERALAALKKLSAPAAKVVRQGTTQAIPARELVPGDLIELEAGDHVPADVRLTHATSLRVQESALTGESTPVDKEAAAVLPETAPLGDRRNMAYLGTVVAAGKGAALVVATGMQTELGAIANLMQSHEPEPTPLQRRLAELGRVLIVVCLLLVAIIFALRLWQGGELLEVLKMSVSLAVAAVPEGLPAVVTIALALGLQRMVRRNALVRKLPSVETLGSVTVICSDKTGTLTRNEMTVREIVAGDERYLVSGAGYTPRGEFVRWPAAASAGAAPADMASPGQPVDPRGQKDLLQVLTIGARCNNAHIRPASDGAEGWVVLGDPTEGALLVAAMKAGIEPAAGTRDVVFEIPFDSQRKEMSLVIRRGDGITVMYTKGAPEVVLAECTHELRSGRSEPLTDERRAWILERNAEMASRALRVLALAFREQPRRDGEDFVERDLVFAGLAGMMDPPREEAKAAVHTCRAAGIRPVMITGDHPQTALAIARELRIAGDSERAISGQQLDELSDEQLAHEVEHLSVYARVSAEHKLRVVQAWKARGQIVAMTGDGVNDAPAVKAADIGIAMGVTGTDVTKEASDMVLLDDNFASIISAVEEGRGIFDNIQKFIHYLLSCNAGEVLFMFFAAIVAWPTPLLAIQVLWINLVTDGLPALALGMERPEPDIMRRRPRPPREGVITLERGLRILFHGLLIAAAAAVGFWVTYDGEQSLPMARTTAFCIMAFSQLFFSFACRSQRYTLPQLGLFSNPQLLLGIVISGLLQLCVVTLPFAQGLFETGTHLAGEWLLVFGLALAPVTVIELGKLVKEAGTRGLRGES
jgi:Ca2+-transporting ATPase